MRRIFLMATTLVLTITALRARADSHLASGCADVSVVGKHVQACSSPEWVEISDSAIVRTASTSMPAWEDPSYTWARFGELPPSALVEVCPLPRVAGELHIASDCSLTAGGWDALLMVSKASLQGAKKWTPGHYMRPAEQGFAHTQAARHAQYARIADDPRVQGALLTVPWGAVERVQGQYDFTQIDADLAVLKRMNKKLIIEPWWMEFWHTLPNLPQDPEAAFVPDYIVAEGHASNLPFGGHIAHVDHPWVMDRYIAFMRALAQRYDGDPAVEQIVITETAGRPATQVPRLLDAMAEAWPRTVVILMMNWVDPVTLIKPLAEQALRLGIGIGAPDIRTPAMGEDHGSRALRGMGVFEETVEGITYTTDFGLSDLRGQIPVHYEYQAMDGVPPAQLIDYAIHTLHATHLVWTVTDWLAPENRWETGVMPVIRANAVLDTQCPATLRCLP